MSTAIDSPKRTPAKTASTPQGVAFMNLREGMCKFPLGRFNEPVELFCGAKTQVGTAYCDDCQSRAFTRHPKKINQCNYYQCFELEV